jgi:hypothetical protein
MSFGTFVLRLLLLRVPVLYQLADLGYFVVTLAQAVRIYILAMSRAHETPWLLKNLYSTQNPPKKSNEKRTLVTSPDCNSYEP